MNSNDQNWTKRLSQELKTRAESKLSQATAARQGPTVVTESKTLPFHRQKHFWKDKNPVDITEFIEDRLGLKPSPGQCDVLYVLAGRDPYEWMTDYQQYNLAIGQGGGKNAYIISPFMAYVAYKIANMTNPWKYFSRFLPVPLDKATRFEMTNSSMVTERQARNVHFAKMQTLLKRCLLRDGRNWFETYTGLDMREGFGDIQSKTITISTQPRCGPIVLHSFDSTPTAPEGLHIILGIIDEASRADTEAKYLDMRRLWRVIVGNLNTRFPLGIGKAINFSYLSNSEYDFTYDLIKQAEEERKQTEKPIIYSINRSTFEMNPNVRRTDPSIEKDYRTDPIDAAARYEGIKGAAREGFYQPHVEKIRECFFELDSPVQYEFGVTERTVVNPQTGASESRRFVRVDLTSVRGDDRPRCWAMDPGVSFDAFILKGGYTETMEPFKEEIFLDNKPEIVTVNQRPVIDIVIVWQPRDGMAVDMLNVGEVLGALISKFPNTRSVSSDKYNSEKLGQEILARGIHSQTYSFSNPQQMMLYKKLRFLFWNNIPQIHLDRAHSIRKGGIERTVGEWNLLEHERLLKINENRVDHPRDGSKDLADVDAMLSYDLSRLEGTGITIAGISTLAYPRLLEWIDRYRYQRDLLRGQICPSVIALGERRRRIAKMMGVTVDIVIVLEEQTDELFPGERWIPPVGMDY